MTAIGLSAAAMVSAPAFTAWALSISLFEHPARLLAFLCALGPR